MGIQPQTLPRGCRFPGQERQSGSANTCPPTLTAHTAGFLQEGAPRPCGRPARQTLAPWPPGTGGGDLLSSLALLCYPQVPPFLAGLFLAILRPPAPGLRSSGAYV